MPHGKPHRNPADVYIEGRFLADDPDPFNPQQPKKKKGHKCPQCTTPATCKAQGRCRLHGVKL